jgi:hypothetical protein
LINNTDILDFIKKLLTSENYHGRIVLTISASKIKHMETNRGYNLNEIEKKIKSK